MYKEIANSATILRLSDQAYIPADSYNTDYQAYLAWLVEGNRPEPADPVPEPVKVMSALEFFERFTEEEQLAIVTATMSNPAVKLWYDKLIAANEVNFSDPRLEAGLNNLVTAELITEDRKQEILS